MRKPDLSESKYPVIFLICHLLSAFLSINFRMIICVSMCLTYSADPGPNMVSKNWPWSSPQIFQMTVLCWWVGARGMDCHYQGSLIVIGLTRFYLLVRGEQQRYGPCNSNDLFVVQSTHYANNWRAKSASLQFWTTVPGIACE